MRSVLLLLGLGMMPFSTAFARQGSQPVIGLEQARAGVALSADTVTVGSPFVVQLRVRAPLDAVVEFPPGPDTTGVVQPLDPPRIVSAEDSTALDQTVSYRLAAWDVGAREVALGRVMVRSGNDVRELVLDPVEVYVATVLPADSAERVPKPARPPITFPRPWWIPWLIALVAAAIIGLLAWWYIRRRRGAGSVAPPINPLADAEQRFRQVDSLGLPEAGEPGLHAALTQEILREYLGRRIPEAPESLTSAELIQALGARPGMPLDRLDPLLREGDLIKFAARSVTPARAREIGRECEALVRAVHDSLIAAEARAAADSAASADSARADGASADDGVGSAA